MILAKSCHDMDILRWLAGPPAEAKPPPSATPQRRRSSSSRSGRTSAPAVTSIRSGCLA